MITLKKNDVIGKYTVEYQIKGGTLSSTYRVSDKNGNPCFMKLYDMSAIPDTMRMDGTVSEIAYSRNIRHENVISYIDDGKEVLSDGNTYAYLITNFFTGKLLSEQLASGVKYDWESAKAIISNVLAGLIYLQESLGLIHNDITPRNIILEQVGPDTYSPRIIDLGHVSKTVGGVPPFCVEDLTLQYCAPETFTGTYGRKSDTFSVAAVLYRMLMGKAPWDVEVPAGLQYPAKKKIVRNARKQPLDTEGISATGIDKAGVDLLLACLEREVASRLSLKAFYDALGGKSTDESSSGSSEKGQKDGPVSGDGEVTTPKEHEEAVSTTVQIRKKTGGGFADVAGMQTLKDELTKRVIWVLKDKEKAEKYRLTPPNGMILYGPPGCGKTYFAEKFAEEAQFNFTMVSGSDLGSTYMHGTQGKIANLFKEAEQRAPVILCFDEFDSFVPSRGSSDANQRGEEVNEFLAQLNNCSKRGIFVIGTTNRIELIDPAILRKGRMDLHVEIPAPDAETRASIFQLHLRERPVAEDVNAQELAGLTENYAAADIAFIVNEAAMMAALADDLIRQEHLVNSIKCNKSSLGEVCVRRKIGY
jgi:transitional endoplasmic reticulum ATPase